MSALFGPAPLPGPSPEGSGPQFGRRCGSVFGPFGLKVGAATPFWSICFSSTIFIDFWVRPGLCGRSNTLRGESLTLLRFLTFAPESDDIVWELCCFPDSWISGAGEREISSGNLPLSEGTPSDPLTKELSSDGFNR